MKWVKCSVSWDFSEEKPVVSSYQIGINNEKFAEILRQTTSPLPCKLTLFPHEILEDFLSEPFFDEDDRIGDEYLCAKALPPSTEDWRAHEYERELLEHYDKEIARVEKEREELPGPLPVPP